MNFKKKAENFWYYYKWHTLAAVFVIAILIISVKSSMDSHDPDFFMVYVSDKYVDNSVSQNLEKSLNDNGLLKDINGDNEKTFVFDPLVTSLDGNGSSDMAVMQKLQVYMMAGEQSLMLVHKYIPEDYDGAFEDISKYASETDTVYTGKSGYVSAISVEGNKYLESMGINTENLYIGMRLRTNKQIEDKSCEKEYEVAYKVLEYILKNNPSA